MTGTRDLTAIVKLLGSPVRAEISLIIDAPAARAACITDDLEVSILIGTPKPLTFSITLITLSISSETLIGFEPGLVDSPPISIISAPSSIKE